MDSESSIVIAVGVVVCAALLICCYGRRAQTKERNTVHQTICQRQIGRSNQQEDIYNISSRVQGQGPWPTHDAHVSLDNFTITNELNKYNDAPPTYEEAMNIAASRNNNVVAPAAVPKTTTTTPTSPTSTSASTTN